MKAISIFSILLLISAMTLAQVGVNTEDPNAELDVAISAANLPALGLEPQLLPTGTATGQIAVIGDQLFMYDDTRSKWLSIDAVPLVYSRTGNVTNENLRISGSVSSVNSGILMPFDGTIVAVTANSNTNTGTATNNLSAPFEIRVRDGTSSIGGAGTFTINLVAGIYTDTITNVDFSAGNYIVVRARNTGTDTINNPVITIWVKRRAS